MIKFDILIPAFNAQATLPQLIDKLNNLDQKPGNIWIVDDGSDDQTNSIIKDSGFHLIDLADNRGKGFALRTGFGYFLKSPSSDYLICMDADLQHPVNSLPEFINRATENNCDVLIGNRRKTFPEMPALRILSNKITSFILSLVTRQKIKDSQCGFRMIHRRVLNTIKLEEDGFQMESEFVLQAVKQKYKIDFVPIPTIYNNEMSNINHIGDTIRFIQLIAKELFSRQ